MSYVDPKSNHCVFPPHPGGEASGYLQPIVQGQSGTYSIACKTADGASFTPTGDITGRYWSATGTQTSYDIASGSLTINGSNIDWALNSVDVQTSGDRWVMFINGDGRKTLPILQTVREDAGASESQPATATALSGTKLEIINTTGDDGVETLVALFHNNGPVHVQYKDTDSNITWDVKTDDDGKLNHFSEGIKVFSIDQTGNVRAKGSITGNTTP